MPLKVIYEVVTPQKEEGLPVNLTPTEVVVFKMICRGWANKQIGNEISASESAVKKHVSAILSKLNFHGRGEILRQFGNVTIFPRTA